MPRSSSSSSSSSSSREAVINNEDLLPEILVRLPLKPLVSFKCVSKQWLSLISSHHLSKTHTTRQGTLPAPSGLFLSNDRLITPLFQYVPLTRSSKTCLSSFALPDIYKILHSCNGLLLDCSRHIPFDFDVDPFDFDAFHNPSSGVTFFVYNPTTKQSRSVFFSPKNSEFSRFECGSYIKAANLAFDPCHSPYFKIVCVLTNPDLEDGYHWLHVYDSQTNTWNSSPIPFDPPETIDFRTPVFYRRAIHWYSHHPTSLYFDVDKQSLHPFPMPHLLSNCGDDECFVQYFGEFRGRLHLIAITTTSLIKFDVLELDEDYFGWSTRYFVNLYTLRLYCRAQGIPNERFVVSALSIVPGEREEDSEELVLFFLDLVYSYNLKNGSINKLMGFSLGLLGEDDQCVNGHPFIPTLCPI